MLFENHVLFFPTFHENYGHVISESLSSGMPVIISSNTPWKDLIEFNAGFEFDLKKDEKFAESIQFFVDLDQSVYNEYSKGAKSYFSSRVNMDEIIELSRSLFKVSNSIGARS